MRQVGVFYLFSERIFAPRRDPYPTAQRGGHDAPSPCPATRAAAIRAGAGGAGGALHKGRRRGGDRAANPRFSGLFQALTISIKFEINI
ncbi:MAG: hypothetical protein C0605_06575 [Hyphomicrobiales bacterium]|nr:MAG: hypothetical protein C0605_06575 [Hyphomicrobiales bacterium]